MPATSASFSRSSAKKATLTLALALLLVPACHRRAQVAAVGATTRTLQVGGVERSYVLYPGSKPTTRRALLLVLHEQDGNGMGIEQRTHNFDALADRDSFVVVYPNALHGRWNDGFTDDATDDVGFLSALVASLSSELDVDPKRVYATGMSNGASMAYRLTCERENLIASFAPVSGEMAPRIAERCKIGRPVPVLAMHGTADKVVPYAGDLRANIAHWVTRNGCSLLPETHSLADTEHGVHVRVERYEQSCNQDAEVMLYTIDGGEHAWPTDFDAAAHIWDFCRHHPMLP